MSGVTTALARGRHGCVVVGGVAPAVRSFEGSPAINRAGRAAVSRVVVLLEVTEYARSSSRRGLLSIWREWVDGSARSFCIARVVLTMDRNFVIVGHNFVARRMDNTCERLPEDRRPAFRVALVGRFQPVVF